MYFAQLHENSYKNAIMQRQVVLNRNRGLVNSMQTGHTQPLDAH